MALIRCSECDREVSDKAKSCPHCGNPISATAAAKPRAGSSAAPAASRHAAAMVAAVILAVAFVSNPSSDRHRSKIREALAERNPVASFLGANQLAAFAAGYHSFGIGSYTALDDRIVSVGAFGMVFVRD